jgi:hypothetical protein
MYESEYEMRMRDSIELKFCRYRNDNEYIR